eukprot:9496289-Lingulodinium_polyedra.AAC.1
MPPGRPRRLRGGNAHPPWAARARGQLRGPQPRGRPALRRSCSPGPALCGVVVAILRGGPPA